MYLLNDYDIPDRAVSSDSDFETCPLSPMSYYRAQL